MQAPKADSFWPLRGRFDESVWKKFPDCFGYFGYITQIQEGIFGEKRTPGSEWLSGFRLSSKNQVSEKAKRERVNNET